MRSLMWIAAVTWLAACSQPPTPAPAASQPSAQMAAAFPDCTWGEVRGAGLIINSYTCPSVRLVEDAALPGFVLETTGQGETHRWPVVRVFDIPAGGTMDSILPAVRAASPALEVASCGFAPARDHPGWLEFYPTGALLETYNRFIAGEVSEPPLPCGEWGPSEAGNRYFFALPGAPSRIVAVDTGSDLQIYDWANVRAAP